jgi:hypothetical protein
VNETYASAPKVPVNTAKFDLRVANSAAIKKVLSPISEKKMSKNACKFRSCTKECVRIFHLHRCVDGFQARWHMLDTKPATLEKC